MATRRKRRRRSWLTCPEVSERIGFGLPAVREMCEAGDFPGAFRRGAGQHWRVPRADVDAYLERRARASQESKEAARAAVIRRKPGER